MEESKLDNLLKEYNTDKEAYKTCGFKIQQLLIDLLNSNNIKFHEVNYRIKDELSLTKKFYLKNKKYNKLEDITDIIGIRVITYYTDDIDKVAQVIEENFDIDEENSIDKRETLEIDRFGYLSLHYIVKLKQNRTKLEEYKCCKNYKIEIQIRTILQHAWAEIEHDLGYKNEVDTPREVRRDFYRLAGLLETADKEFLGIRNQINEYEDNIDERIKDEEETIYIDKISLNALVNNDMEYNRLIERLEKETKVEFHKSEISSIYVELLLYMKYDTINQVKENLIKYEEDICKIAKEIVGSKKEGLPKIAILLYLCYAQLAEKNDKEEFFNFFSQDIFKPEDREKRIKFIERLLKACGKNKIT